jgi:polar amino acid transport system substrate-binding protein
LRITIIVLLLIFQSAFASDATLHLRIPVNPEPPWVIQEGDKLSGIDINIIKILSKELGFTYVLKPCPWARCLKTMEEGQADFMLGVFKRPEREEYLAFVEPGYLVDDPKSFYVTADSSVAISSYEDLLPLNIGVVRGVAYFERFDNDNQLRKQAVSDEWQLLQMLMLNRLDTFIGTPTAIAYQINKHQLKAKFRRAIFQHHTPAYSHMAISKKSPFIEQLDLVSKTVSRFREEGRFQQVVNEFLNTEASSDDID